MAERFFDVSVTPDKEVVLRFRPGRLRVVPKKSREHIRNASKELLLALRTVLDKAIELVEEEKAPQGRRTRIEVKESKGETKK